MSKPRIGMYWCSGCGGCEESIVDLADHLLEVADAADIVFWPVAMDFKLADVEALPDGSLAAVLINGAVRLDEQARVARLLRRKARLVIAQGACAHMGGVVGLGNFAGRDALLRTAYAESPALAGGEMPRATSQVDGHAVALPTLLERVCALDRVIEVDYVIPGCPPTPRLILAALRALLAGTLPPRGTVLADSRALCDSCPRRASKPERLDLKGFRRVHEVELDPERCCFAQGVVCMGPVTRGGCEARCLGGNMPCTGCFGPVDGVHEAGARFATTLGSTVNLSDPEDVRAWVRSVADPAGQLYRYSLATSALRGGVATERP